jgi:hypothetical protein
MSRALIVIDFINEFLHPDGKVTPLSLLGSSEHRMPEYSRKILGQLNSYKNSTTIRKKKPSQKLASVHFIKQDSKTTSKRDESLR